MQLSFIHNPKMDELLSACHTCTRTQSRKVELSLNGYEVENIKSDGLDPVTSTFSHASGSASAGIFQGNQQWRCDFLGPQRISKSSHVPCFGVGTRRLKPRGITVTSQTSRRGLK